VDAPNKPWPHESGENPVSFNEARDDIVESRLPILRRVLERADCRIGGLLLGQSSDNGHL
jgi:hypothetical protein